MRAVIGSTYVRFDKGGENFYDQISALHKSVRGSDPDAALYWLCRMLEGGCDPLYIARRALRMASEDIGNADPRALTLSFEACAVYERLGSPEGELAIAQAIVFMACAAKSNAVYMAYNAAAEDAARLGSLEVPLHLRNAPTRLMKEIGYGKGYRYAHDEPDAYAAGRALLSRRHARPALLRARAARPRNQDRRGAGRAPCARDARLGRIVTCLSRLAYNEGSQRLRNSPCSIRSCCAAIYREWPPSWRAAVSSSMSSELPP